MRREAYRYDPYLDTPEFGPVIYSGFERKPWGNRKLERAVREFHDHYLARHPFGFLLTFRRPESSWRSDFEELWGSLTSRLTIGSCLSRCLSAHLLP